jgi:hypothetical protein
MSADTNPDQEYVRVQQNAVSAVPTDPNKQMDNIVLYAGIAGGAFLFVKGYKKAALAAVAAGFAARILRRFMRIGG